ncbi:MAG: hypothetical protein AAF517_15185, partial [Planctomycetota bacterium]
MTVPATPTLDRRSFLKATGVALALPWLECVVGASDAAPPRRMVFVCTALGIHAPAWLPKTRGKNYETTEYLELVSPRSPSTWVWVKLWLIVSNLMQ